ncbi:hypothetical protein PROFUN_16539 [Planoprotostelium fungivorum]|uniref:Uncharacterized protein n=1 Tax=Planoprotostelium fungivorum TaxID=1890364 RepID=A0A2P6MQJ4_9EUKA|nr:hypothetical protein PROFUN_16539 [Planoprotostelium fungivorum]
MTRAWDDDIPMETDSNSHVIEGEAVETYQALSEMYSAQRRQIKSLAKIFCASPRMLLYTIIHALEERYPLSHYYPGVDAKAARLGRHTLTDYIKATFEECTPKHMPLLGPELRVKEKTAASGEQFKLYRLEQREDLAK